MIGQLSVEDFNKCGVTINKLLVMFYNAFFLSMAEWHRLIGEVRHFRLYKVKENEGDFL